MRMIILGGCGAWPAAGQACSGYLVEQDGFRLLIDPGYAILPRLLEDTAAEDIDAVLISHGHPDHCADLHPLLRARSFWTEELPPLPVHTLPGAVDPVLGLDPMGALAGMYVLRDFTAGESFDIGPLRVDSWSLPHWVPNAGLRLTAGGKVLAYTGDTGPSPDVIELARDADMFLAEASYVEGPPSDYARYLTSARHAGENATRAGSKRLLLTHLLPGTDPRDAEDAARATFVGEIGVAHGGLAVEID
ncbi:MAG: MBL fold metallo-hydrolase [Candidatus Limnocylindria bacterium]